MPHTKVASDDEDVQLVHQPPDVLGLDLEPASLPGAGPVHRLHVLHHDALFLVVDRLVQGVSTVLAGDEEERRITLTGSQLSVSLHYTSQNVT